MLIDWYVASFSTMLIGILECIIIGWIYGTADFCVPYVHLKIHYMLKGVDFKVKIVSLFRIFNTLCMCQFDRFESALDELTVSNIYMSDISYMNIVLIL